MSYKVTLGLHAQSHTEVVFIFLQASIIHNIFDKY